jgi:gamma-glutamylcyclotransferase (GGCT)/AIG2-like uncharacterized protein YtfP
MNRLFTYGNLVPGRANEHILKGIDGTWQKASIKGILYEKGWGDQMGYPGVILDSSASSVEGFIFTSNKLNEKWDFLDDFEGEDYERVVVRAKLLDNNEFVEAFVYTLKED